jgi:hypothetical protein
MVETRRMATSTDRPLVETRTDAALTLLDVRSLRSGHLAQADGSTARSLTVPTSVSLAP